MDWIKDKLPPIGCWVLVFWRGSTETGYSIARMDSEQNFSIDHAGCGCCSESLEIYKLKGWMHLPKPPEA